MFIAILLAVVFSAPYAPPAYARETSVINSINVSTNTGGSRAEYGTVTEGTSRASVDITTVVNGETVEDIHEETSGEALSIERTAYASTTDAIVSTDVRLSASPKAVSAPHSEEHGHEDTGTERTPTANEHEGEAGIVSEPREQASDEHITSITSSNQPSEEGTAEGAPETKSGLLGFAQDIVHSLARLVSYVASFIFS